MCGGKQWERERERVEKNLLGIRKMGTYRLPVRKVRVKPTF